MSGEPSGGDDPTGGIAEDLLRWAAAARADDAGRSRAKGRWLRRQAQEEATFAGLLVDLAERRAAVVVRTVAGRMHRGQVAAVGADFALLRSIQDRPILLPLVAVSTVRPAGVGDDGRNGGDGPASGRRRTTVDLLLAEALEALAGDRCRIAVAAAGDRDVIGGELEAIGDDVLTIRLDGAGRKRTFISLAAVTEVAIVAR